MGMDFRARDYLRNATGEQHAYLDSAASRMPLDTASGYARFLSSQASVLIPLEVSLERNGIARLLPDWLERRRAKALEADLVELHTPVVLFNAPSFRSDAELLGAAYVLEGSRLGARIILKQLGQRTATRFLRHGEGSRFWQSFLDILEANYDVREDPERASRAARHAFALFIDAMTPREMAAA